MLFRSERERKRERERDREREREGRRVIYVAKVRDIKEKERKKERMKERMKRVELVSIAQLECLAT